MSAQKVEPGKVAIASGYTTNTSPGPATSTHNEQKKICFACLFTYIHFDMQGCKLGCLL